MVLQVFCVFEKNTCAVVKVGIACELSQYIRVEMPLVQFLGENLLVKVTHRTFGGLCKYRGKLITWKWQPFTSSENGHLMNENGHPQLRIVFWVQKRLKLWSHGNTLLVPFLNIGMVHRIPYSTKDLECHNLSLLACIVGVRLGGWMNYGEALLQSVVLGKGSKG